LSLQLAVAPTLAMNLLAYVSIALGTAAAAAVVDHPDYASLAGMSNEDLAVYERSIKIVGSQPLPPPIKDTSFKLIYDEKHPQYLPRNGVATPAQIIEAIQIGFNGLTNPKNMRNVVTKCYGGRVH